MTTLVFSSSDMHQATLWQTVLDPTPPLAPTNAKMWPTGSDWGSL